MQLLLPGLGSRHRNPFSALQGLGRVSGFPWAAPAGSGFPSSGIHTQLKCGPADPRDTAGDCTGSGTNMLLKLL